MSTPACCPACSEFVGCPPPGGDPNDTVFQVVEDTYNVCITGGWRSTPSSCTDTPLQSSYANCLLNIRRRENGTGEQCTGGFQGGPTTVPAGQWSATFPFIADVYGCNCFG